ncbi:MAG: ribosome-associated translation inhibitor RaiA [Sutterellaceae bacterium]|nr:ribosome-associated translation inhibitor RaiA [Burkholderiaceae bacterium]MCX7901757.1 ribosome-associated translation inhibitor RaiA [Burkholderiaceae bacterium]MDW8430255.1 ribosome-associated translation inhibitor RaiA [Sutterellaceae bacterium]
MNLIIHGHHVEVTPALRGYVEGKLARVRRHFDHVIEADVLLSVEDKLRQKAEITMRVRGSALHAEAVDQDMYAAIDCLVDRLDRQVLRHKDRLKDHAREPLKHQNLGSF